MAGQHVLLDAPLDARPPLLAREGCAIPLNVGPIHFDGVEDARGFQVFPLQGTGIFETTCFEDDGHSQACREGRHGQWRLRVESGSTFITIELVPEGLIAPSQRTVTLRFPAAEQRELRALQGKLQRTNADAYWTELILTL